MNGRLCGRTCSVKTMVFKSVKQSMMLKKWGKLLLKTMVDIFTVEAIKSEKQTELKRTYERTLMQPFYYQRNLKVKEKKYIQPVSITWLYVPMWKS